MPKSKRDKKISLTKVEKKSGLETKQKLVDNVRTCVDTYSRLVEIEKVLALTFSDNKWIYEGFIRYTANYFKLY